MSKRPLPQYEILGKDPAPKNLADWQGLRVRAGGGQGDAMEVLGASKQTLPAVETATAFQRGALDAASFPYTYAHVVLVTGGWYKPAQWNGDQVDCGGNIPTH